MTKSDNTEALLKALRHPLRRSLLRRWLEAEAAYGLSSKEIALEEKAPLSKVSYHVRELARLGLLEIVSEVPSRGSVARFYEVSALVKETPWLLSTLGLEG